MYITYLRHIHPPHHLVTAHSKLLESHERWRAAQPALIKEDTTGSKAIHSFTEDVLPPLAARGLDISAAGTTMATPPTKPCS